MKSLTTMLTLFLLAAPAAGGFVCERWGNAPQCDHRGTMKVVTGQTVEFDLSALRVRSPLEQVIKL